MDVFPQGIGTAIVADLFPGKGLPDESIDEDITDGFDLVVLPEANQEWKN